RVACALPRRLDAAAAALCARLRGDVFAAHRPGGRRLRLRFSARHGAGRRAGDSLAVIPGRREAASTESITTSLREDTDEIVLHCQRIWIPGPAHTRRPGMTSGSI